MIQHPHLKMSITIRYPFRPARPSVHSALVADLFGIAADAGWHVVAEDLELPVAAGSIIAFTGPSGSGKSSLLRGLAEERERLGEPVVRADALPLPDSSVIDALSLTFDEAPGLL
jgi:ATPase subunit of ABC transporter with duplicated ATPase domains